MKYIPFIFIFILTSGCSNLILPTIYAPDELRQQEPRNLEGLGPEELKANPLSTLAVIFTNSAVRNLTIDSKDSGLRGFSIYRRIVISPGKHTLQAKLNVSELWEPFQSYMKENGFGYYIYDCRWSRANNKCFDSWTKEDNFNDTNGDLIDMVTLGNIAYAAAFWTPVSAEFTAEAGKVYYLNDLIKNAKFILEGSGT